jgi:peroxiredoxin (alkyl hydroperoxide reductase subunit C)
MLQFCNQQKIILTMSNHLANVGQEFPAFDKLAVVSLEKGKEFGKISSEDHKKGNRWMVMFWYPKDFTFVCPTEIASFNNSFDEFRDRDTDLIGASTDSEFVHLAWRRDHDDLRATFIVDPTGIIRWVCVNDLAVGRNVEEVLRVLDALQTDELCPCNWEKGQETIKV